MTDTTSTPLTADSSPSSWKIAADLLTPFGTTAANFSEAIRLLVAAHFTGEPLSVGGRSHTIRLLNSDTIKATYYFLTKQFKPSLLNAERPLLPKHFMDSYTPIDHAAIVTLCYLFKNLSKKIDKEEWDYVQTPLYEALVIGGHIGLTVQEVGLGIGLLTRGLRYLAFAPLMRENRKAFKEYREHLKKADVAFDPIFEQKMWQCTTVQLTSLLLEQMGYPREVALQFVAAVDRDSSVTPDPQFGIPFRLAECLVDTYMEGHEIPTTTPTWIGKDISLPAEVRGNLLSSLKHATIESNRIDWLNKTSSDITPTQTPELFSPEAPPPER